MDLEEAKRNNYVFGVKLVRGAYMDQERLRAQTLNYDDPIQPDYNATTQCYHSMLGLIMDNIRNSEIIVATHNESTIKFAINKWVLKIKLFIYSSILELKYYNFSINHNQRLK